MSILSIDAGKTLCELSGWSMSSLRLQKVLYIAHMFHLGWHDQPLVRDGFEAWEYGPVAPNLYHHTKGYGNRNIGDIFGRYQGADEGSSEYDLLQQALEATKSMTGGQLVAITHRKPGAWQEVYHPGARHTPIPDDLIKQEYRDKYAEKFPDAA